MTNRRQFLTGCSTLGLAAAFSPTAVSAASVLIRDAAPAQLSYESFAMCLGTTFLLRQGTGPAVALELTQARQQAPSPFESVNAPDASHERFSLIFRGPQNAALPQNTYTFEHRRLGRFEMFIVPVGVKEEAQGSYEAVFNRPLTAAQIRRLAAGGTNLGLENKNKI